MSLLQSLIGDGKIAGWWDFRSGTVADWSGSGHDGTVTSAPYFSPDGLHFDGVDDVVEAGNVAASVKTAMLLLCSDVASESFLDLDGGTHSIEVAAGTVTATGWDAPTVYVGGVAGSSLPASENRPIAVTTATGFSASDVSIGQEAGFFSGMMSSVLLCTDELTATEIAQLTEELESLRWPTKRRARARAASLIDPVGDAPLAAYDMELVGTTFPDLTGGSLGGDKLGAVVMSHGLLGHGMSGYPSLGLMDVGTQLNGNAVLYVSMWLRTGADVTTGQWIFNKWESNNDGWGLNLYNGSLDLYDDIDNANTRRYSPTAYPNRAYHVVVGLSAAKVNEMWLDGVAMDNDEAASDDLASFNGDTVFGGYRNLGPSLYNPFQGSLFGVEVFDRELTTTEIAELYQRGARALQWGSDWGGPVTPAEVASGPLGDTEWEVISGAYKVSTDTIDGQPVKVIECVTAGVLALDLSPYMHGPDAAFGTWEAWVNKANASLMDVGFAVTTTGLAAGYGVRIDTDESVKVMEYGGAVLTSSAGAVTPDSWHKIKLTRRYDCLFSLSLDDGVPVTATDATTVSARYICLDLDAGDKVALSGTKGEYAMTKKLGVV